MKLSLTAKTLVSGMKAFISDADGDPLKILFIDLWAWLALKYWVTSKYSSAGRENLADPDLLPSGISVAAG